MCMGEKNSLTNGIDYNDQKYKNFENFRERSNENYNSICQTRKRLERNTVQILRDTMDRRT